MLPLSYAASFTLLTIAAIVQQQVVIDDAVVLRFLEHPTTSSSVVRLKDVIEVVSGRSSTLQQMLEMPLGPAPRHGQVQRWLSDDILQHLELRGIHSASIRWSGPQAVDLRRAEKLAEQIVETMTPAFANDALVQQAQRNVVQVISEYLNLKNSQAVEWRIEATIPVEHVPMLKMRRQISSIGGGQPPWLGKQEFVLQVKHRDGVENIRIEADVQLPPMVVAAARPLRRGELIQPDMLTYRPLSKSDEERESQYFTNFEQCLGKEVRRSLSTGQSLSAEAVGEPIVIQRNDLIEVESVAGSIVVRSAAKALGSGAVGDLIEIELQPDRQRLHAAVVGHAMVRIAAVPSRTKNSRTKNQ